jgi:hypothetical protein
MAASAQLDAHVLLLVRELWSEGSSETTSPRRLPVAEASDLTASKTSSSRVMVVRIDIR